MVPFLLVVGRAAVQIVDSDADRPEDHGLRVDMRVDMRADMRADMSTGVQARGIKGAWHACR